MHFKRLRQILFALLIFPYASILSNSRGALPPGADQRRALKSTGGHVCDSGESPDARLKYGLQATWCNFFALTSHVPARLLAVTTALPVFVRKPGENVTNVCITLMTKETWNEEGLTRRLLAHRHPISQHSDNAEGSVHDIAENLNHAAGGYSSSHMSIRKLSRRKAKRRDDGRTATEAYENRSVKRILPLRIIDTYEKLQAEYQEDQKWQNEQLHQGTSPFSLGMQGSARQIRYFNDLLLKPPPQEENILLGGERSFEFVNSESLNMDNYESKHFYKANDGWRETQKYENAQKRQALMSSLDEDTLKLIQTGASTLAASLEGVSGGKSKAVSALTTVAHEAEKLALDRGDFSGYINLRTGLPCIPSPEQIYCVVQPTSTSTRAPPTFLELLRHRREKEKEGERQRNVQLFFLQEKQKKMSYVDPYERPVIYTDYVGDGTFEPVPASTSLSRFNQEFLARKREHSARLQNHKATKMNDEALNTVTQLAKSKRREGAGFTVHVENQPPRSQLSIDAFQEDRDLLAALMEQQYKYQEVNPVDDVGAFATYTRRDSRRKLSIRGPEQIAADPNQGPDLGEEDGFCFLDETGKGTHGRQEKGRKAEIVEDNEDVRGNTRFLSVPNLRSLSPPEQVSSGHKHDDNTLLQEARKFQKWIMSAAYLPEELAPFQRGTNVPTVHEKGIKSPCSRAKRKKQERQQDRLSRLMESFTESTYADELQAAASSTGELFQPVEALTGSFLRTTAMPPMLAKKVQNLQERRHERVDSAERRREKRLERSQLAQEAASLDQLEQMLRLDTAASISSHLKMAEDNLK